MKMNPPLFAFFVCCALATAGHAQVAPHTSGQAAAPRVAVKTAVPHHSTGPASLGGPAGKNSAVINGTDIRLRRKP